MKILHIFGRMQRAGAELRTIDVMRVLQPERYQLEFLSLTGLPGILDEEIRGLGGEVHYVPLGPLFPWRFAALIRRRRYDCVHSHVHFFSGLPLALARASGVSVRVAHFRITDAPRRSKAKAMQDWGMRVAIDKCATDILGVSEGVLDSAWAGWRSDARCRVVYNGLNPAAFQSEARSEVLQSLGVPEDAFVAINVGRIEPEKNHLRLLEIFRAVRRYKPRAWLLLAGRDDTADAARLRAAVAASSCEDRVVFLGVRDDVPRLLSAADVMIHPSVREGLPGAVLEAAAAGLPVVATDLPGVLEISARVPGVVPVALSAPDELWADRASAAADEVRSNASRRAAARRAFEGSVFTVRRAAEELASVWERRLSSRRRAP